MEYSIYVACLASYNNGYLHGKWIDCTQGVDHVLEEVNAMLKDSKEPDAEEWAIHDYSFDGYDGIEEWTSFDKCCAIAEALSSADYPKPVIEWALSEGLCEVEDINDYLSDAYIGEYESVGDYAYVFSHECYDMKVVGDHFVNYIDFNAMGRDWELSGDIHAIDNGYKSVYIVRNQ